MKMINEITKFLSNLTYQEKRLPTNLTEAIDIEVDDFQFAIEVLATKDDHYFVLVCDVDTAKSWGANGDPEEGDESFDNDVITSVDYACRYNYDGEEIEKHVLTNKQSEEVLDLLPSLSDIN